MKKYMIKGLALASIMVAAGALQMYSQTDDQSTKYRRSSLYSVLVSHDEQKYFKEIQTVFGEIPIPEKYNDHDLSVKVLSVSSKSNYDQAINDFVNNHNVASRMVAKWFNRDKFTGTCDMELVKERGLYDATVLDRELASRSQRGAAMLADAGEELIGNSFLLVNEVNYVDKNENARKIGGFLKVLGAVTGYDDLGNLAGDAISSIKGFSVKIHTRLYQLNWDDEGAAIFYKDCFTFEPDEAKRQAFEDNRDKFKLTYVGDIESKGGTTSFLGINEEEPLIMVRKACQRAIDDNIADLQKKYEQFRVKSPIREIADNGDILIEIGMKEAIDENSKYEVLMPEEKNGQMKYKRVAIIKPVKNKIWDNRYMAVEEGAVGATLGATTFRKDSGGDIYPGLLVREID